MNHATSRTAERGHLKQMTGIAILSAIIVVLQIICTFIRFGPFSITLALTPIIIGSAVYGKKAGAFLGAVLGLVVLVTGILGWDGGTVIYLLSQNAIGCILICIVKTAAAGWISGLVYELLSKKSIHLAVVCAGIVCPIVNTGLFIIGMMIFFMSDLTSWANGQALGYYLIFGLTGINFLVEMITNIILSTGVTTIIKAGKRG